MAGSVARLFSSLGNLSREQVGRLVLGVGGALALFVVIWGFVHVFHSSDSGSAPVVVQEDVPSKIFQEPPDPYIDTVEVKKN